MFEWEEIKLLLKIPMSLIGRFGKKAGGVTKQDIKYLKDIKFFDLLRTARNR